MFGGKFLCVVIATNLFFKLSNDVAKSNGGVLEVIEGRFSMKSKLGKCVPSCKFKQHMPEDLVVFVW